MTKWMVMAEAYSLDAGGVSEFDVADAINAHFKLWPDAVEIYKESHKEKVHRSTGTVTLQVEEAATPNDAIDSAEMTLTSYSQSLTFAHGHHVFFHNFRAYRPGEEELSPSGAAFYPIRVGPRRGIGGVVYIPWQIPDYLTATIPKLTNAVFCEETGLSLALLWYNEPLIN